MALCIDCLPLSLFLSEPPLPLLLPLSSKPSTTSNSNNGNNDHRVTDLDRAILQLKTQRRHLEGAAARTARLVEREREAALVAASSGKREAALAALRRKKLHETRLAAVDSYSLTVESVLAGIDDARGAAAVASALRSGAAALKGLRSLAPLAEVEAILNDSRAAAEYEASMASLLGSAGTGLDASQEASVEEELEALQVPSSEEGGREVREEAGRLPEAPRHEVEKTEREEDLPSVPTGAVDVAGKERGQGAEEKQEEPGTEKGRVQLAA